MKAYCEIFEEFAAQTTKSDRIAILRKYDTVTLRRILRCIFHPTVKFFITKVPAYKIDPGIIDPTMSDFRLEHVMSKIYLFDANNLDSNKLSYAKREQLLIQFLEGMHEREGKLLLNILFKVSDVPYLTEALVREVWPGMLPPKSSEDAAASAPAITPPPQQQAPKKIQLTR